MKALQVCFMYGKSLLSGSRHSTLSDVPLRYHSSPWGMRAWLGTCTAEVCCTLLSSECGKYRAVVIFQCAIEVSLCCCCCCCIVLAPGESYAGIYVPTLTQAVVDGNLKGQEPHINIKVGGRET